ncbi:hypothetical protein TUM19329_31800 [Legionella antarctica]|uniref:Uncharacterized protein n=1 Tax=Legionella antarctica TaxID=2708020 RepID=A0A6F8T8L5_9GAMM|nr:hypothetical protein [Legionella antarctica]BCA96819.1 hypothetical protein TUM19329_31800 [Legionella antarctica]
MWYQKLLKPLTLKVIEADQGRANIFLVKIFQVLERISKSPIPAEALLNLIDKMYKKYDQKINDSVKLVDFCQDLLVLSMLFMKGASDKPVWNSDFDVLWLNKELGRTYLGFISGNIEEIHALERQAFKELGYSLETDFANLLTIFSKEDQEIAQLNGLIREFEDLSNQSEGFDEFISCIKKIITEKEEKESQRLKFAEQSNFEEQRKPEEKHTLEKEHALHLTINESSNHSAVPVEPPEFNHRTTTMRQIHLANAQTVNACTLISVAVINAILNARDETAMEVEIAKAHDESQKRYREDFTGLAHGEGVLETAAYQKYYSNAFADPVSQTLIVPVDNEALKQIIDNRNGFLENKGLELNLNFFTYNGDLTETIQQLAPTQEIDWTTVTEDELQRIVQQDKRLPLVDQILRLIVPLNAQGITIRMDGHTISLVKREDAYYSYDSLTGDLSITKNSQEMAEHLGAKIATNQAKEALIYCFSPLQVLRFAPDSSVKKEKTVKKEVPHKDVAVETAGLNAEIIHDLINNRDLFDTVDEWQQVNANLFTLIVSRLNVVYLSAGEWATITAGQLCSLLNIEDNPISTVPPHVSGHPSSIPPVTEGIKQEEHISPVIKPIIHEMPQVPVNDAPEQPVQDSEKLIAIIDKLIENMSIQQNGRQTTRNSQWKANLLTAIKEDIQLKDSEAIDINQCIADIRTVCAKKRNILHFWAEPHSVSEFEKMVRDEEIATPQTNVLAQ